jgi:hypothetical protein
VVVTLGSGGAVAAGSGGAAVVCCGGDGHLEGRRYFILKEDISCFFFFNEPIPRLVMGWAWAFHTSLFL